MWLWQGNGVVRQAGRGTSPVALECTMAEERSMRKPWRAVVKRAMSAFTTDLSMVESATACWTDKTDGRSRLTASHSAAMKDQRGACEPR